MASDQVLLTHESVKTSTNVPTLKTASASRCVPILEAATGVPAMTVLSCLRQTHPSVKLLILAVPNLVNTPALLQETTLSALVEVVTELKTLFVVKPATPAPTTNASTSVRSQAPASSVPAGRATKSAPATQLDVTMLMNAPRSPVSTNAPTPKVVIPALALKDLLPVRPTRPSVLLPTHAAPPEHVSTSALLFLVAENALVGTGMPSMKRMIPCVTKLKSVRLKPTSS